MLVYSSPRYERNGYGDMVYKRDATCGECGAMIGSQESYKSKKEGYSFKDRYKKNYIFCPYCGKELKYLEKEK